MKMNSISLLKSKKLKVTPQRVSVLNVIQSGGHFTGEQVHNEIRKKMPGISLSTVYNTLDILEKNGILNSFEVNGMKWYDSKRESHVNVFCSDKNEVIDIDVDLSTLLNELKKKGINADKVSIVAYSSSHPDRS